MLLIREMPHFAFDPPIECPYCKSEIGSVDSRIEKLSSKMGKKRRTFAVAMIAAKDTKNKRIGTRCSNCMSPLIIDIDRNKAELVDPTLHDSRDLLDEFDDMTYREKVRFVDSLSDEEFASIVLPSDIEEDQVRGNILTFRKYLQGAENAE